MDATIPTTSASITTIHTTWLPVAPTARNRASSRWRWRTMIRNVFWMMKPATNTDTAAKTSNAVRRKPRLSESASD